MGSGFQNLLQCIIAYDNITRASREHNIHMLASVTGGMLSSSLHLAHNSGSKSDILQLQVAHAAKVAFGQTFQNVLTSSFYYTSEHGI